MIFQITNKLTQSQDDDLPRESSEKEQKRKLRFIPDLTYHVYAGGGAIVNSIFPLSSDTVGYQALH